MHNSFHLYNTLSRRKELFQPINPWKIWIYSCGPTVYGAPHVGNLRKYFMDDLLKNTLKHICGYETTHVVNITDVWHLVSDEDSWEDKMEKWAKRDWITAWDVAKKYEQIFRDDLKTLRIDDFDVMPRATEHIVEQIEMVKILEEKWYTYIIDWDWVYMDTSKVADYWVLVWQKHIDWIQSGSRIEDSWKRNPTDFALRKFNVTWMKRDMEWDSPWGSGFPGWHIECSAMSIKYLWKHFDIHTWGIDHVPVHHTNEIAQSQCSAWDTPWVNYRVHYQFLNVDGEKIAKSSWNGFTLDELQAKWFEPEDLRYFYFQAHCRSFQDFTFEWLEAAKSARRRLKNIFKNYINVTATNWYTDDIWYLAECISDDLDTPKMIARLWAWIDALDDELVSAIKRLDVTILKLWLFDKDKVTEIPQDIQLLAQNRREAKQSKDFARSDEIRWTLLEKWRVINDSKDWFAIEKKAW